MCLYIKRQNVLKANRNITAYKIIQYDGEKRFTPFMKKRIDNDIIVGKEPFVVEQKTVKERYGKLFRVSKGVVYTYACAKPAFEMAELLRYHYGGNYEIYECVVPKGTSYYDGTDELMEHVYASKKIRFVKRLEIKKENPIIGASQLKLDI